MAAKKRTGTKSSQPKTKVSTAGKKKPADPGKAFPIIGLGASAGGLEALKAFFAELPEKSGMAYIVVVHMAPNQPSMMPSLLQTVTAATVSAAKDGERVKRDHIYVIPPNKEISVYNGKIQLLEVMKKSATLPIDLFLRSLAQDQTSNAVAIILSGTGTDGTLGIKEIKSNDGLVLVQDEKTAGYDGMPRSAIGTGLVDMVLPAEEMPKWLEQFFNHSRKAVSLGTTTTGNRKGEHQEWINKIFYILRAKVGHDFSAYKINTILRRITRRMSLNCIDSHEVYVRFMRENPKEVDALFRELLIGVTNFFRDVDSFDVLKKDVLPGLIEQVGQDATLRVWVPGCSTGEEVYSLAIVLRECLEKSQKQVQLQLFGTDIDSHAIDKAREGLFPASISADVSKERLKRFFTKDGDSFRIKKEIRDCAVFSVQDVIKDPPFSRLSLLCCRNLLIYLDTEAQKKLLPLFHYTLNPGGILVLGSSETIGGFSNIFKTLDKKWKIFSRIEVPPSMRQMVDFPSGPSVSNAQEKTSPAQLPVRPTDIGQLAQKAVLEQFAPTSVLVNGKGDILHIMGRTGKYLEAASGPPSNNILDLAREGLRIELSSALRSAKSVGGIVTRKHVSVRTNGETQMIDLHVCPQQAPNELVGNLLVVFEDIDTSTVADTAQTGGHHQESTESSRIAELESELQITRESHQTTIEELESSNEELKSTNEEMQSSNEELQSTNEELESSKEELQSLNEELQTVNAELQSKVEELSAAHDDMRNLMNSTEVATIFVDNHLRIRRFTPEATKIVNLIQTDIGRPLEHVVSNLEYGNMIADLNDVLKKLTPKEVEVQTANKEWFSMRIMPYRTTDNRIEGGVLTFSSIDDQKKAQEILRTSITSSEQAQKLVRSVYDMNDDPLVVLDSSCRIVIANTSYSELFAIKQNDVDGADFIKMHADVSRKIGLKTKLAAALKKGEGFITKKFEVKTSTGNLNFSISGRIIEKTDDFPYRILLRFSGDR
jgi:two-component system CheB/CheR fusion protein